MTHVAASGDASGDCGHVRVYLEGATVNTWATELQDSSPSLLTCSSCTQRSLLTCVRRCEPRDGVFRAEPGDSHVLRLTAASARAQLDTV